jgi:hypothetical protein
MPLTMTNTFEIDLRSALELACRSQNVGNILKGRQEIFAMPKGDVLANIERIAADSLPLGDEWEFRRLLELYEELDRGLLARLVELGLSSGQAEVIEAAEDFRSR